ncbi:Death domain-associated protein 6 [Taenia solium]|eukprot:TsM_000136000 transcript=TsM_000136000 gene=TsM_000136000
MEKIWNGFLEQLRPLLPRNDNAVIAKLTRKFVATSLAFQRNAHTVKLLNRYINRIRASPSKVYVILLELKRKLTKYEPSTNENSPPLWDTIDLSKSSHDIPKRRVDFITLTEPSPSDSISRRCSEKATLSEISTPKKPKHPRVDELTISLDESPEASDTSEPELVNSIPFFYIICVVNSYRQEEEVTTTAGIEVSLAIDSPQIASVATSDGVDFVSASLQFLSRAIRRLEEAEMDATELDQEESAYLRLDALKREHLAVWRQFCRLRGISRHAGSLTRLPFRCSGSRFPVINRAVERHVNASHTFPDYADIYKVVEETSTRENLGLSVSAIETLARQIFTDVGATLKHRRERQFRHDFGCHLTDEQAVVDEDPALHSAELRRRLLDNRRIAKSNFESLINKYSRLQEDLEKREASPQCQNEEHRTTPVDLDAVEFVDITDETTGPPFETSSGSHSEETPMPITFPDAIIESPVFIDDLDLDGEEHHLQAQVGSEEVSPAKCLGEPPSTITISDDEDEVVFRGYRPPPKDSSTVHTLISGDQMTLSLSNGGSLVISRTQRHVLQVISPVGMTQQQQHAAYLLSQLPQSAMRTFIKRRI